MTTMLAALVSALLVLASVGVVLLAVYNQWQGVPEQTPYIGSLLGGASTDRMIPWVIVIAFSATLVLCFARAIQLMLDWRLSLMFAQGTHKAFRAGVGRGGGGTLARSRMTWLASLLERSPGQPPLELLQARASLDSAALGNAFVPLRTLIWLLPVLGFIGTAWGMSVAIDSFSLALREVEDTRALAARLGQLVIPSLAHAFHTTMFALATAIVGHLASSMLQSLHEGVLDTLDRRSLDIVASMSSEGASSGVSPFGGFELGEARSAFSEFANAARARARAGPAVSSAAMALDGTTKQLQEAATGLSKNVTGATQALANAAQALTHELERPLTVTIERKATK